MRFSVSVQGLTLSLLDYLRPSQTSLKPQPLQFELRHLHAQPLSSTPSTKVIFSDVPPGNAAAVSAGDPTTYSVDTSPIRTFRPRSRDVLAQLNPRLRSRDEPHFSNFLWDDEEILAPNISSRQTLLELAKMTGNAYLDRNDTRWYDLGNQWNTSYEFGWEPDADGFRGHVFATPDNSTVVLSIKGTSAGFFGGGGPTAIKDKLNDNLLFSCCCARVDWTWSTVCDCYRGGWNCEQNCLETALIEDSLFYSVGINLYNNLTYMYPYSNIWIIGHSLGGALASLIGATFGSPVVTFEAPGEKMAASRLHLPSPPSTHHITHVWHNADPIATGTCNGVLSSCAIGGYAMESKCHLGNNIMYDTIQNLSWSSDIRTHTISTIVERLLAEPWAPAEEVGREVPEPAPQDDCVECYRWEFGDYD